MDSMFGNNLPLIPHGPTPNLPGLIYLKDIYIFNFYQNYLLSYPHKEMQFKTKFCSLKFQIEGECKLLQYTPEAYFSVNPLNPLDLRLRNTEL